jgi:hypothetical protein
VLPNLLIGGVQKGGTSWLHRMLEQHPSFFMSETKELNYFNRADKVADDQAWTAYQQDFAGSEDRRWRGESTPAYFWHRNGSPYSPRDTHDSAAAIRDRLGTDIDVILVLRDPTSRAISGYWHNFAQGRFDLVNSLFRLPPQMGIIDLGFYRRHYEHWAATLGTERLHVLLYDDLVSDARQFLVSALEALGAEAGQDYLASIPLSGRVHEIKIVRNFKRNLKPIHSIEIAALVDIYRDDIEFVRQLTARSLPGWDDVDALVEALT